MLVTVIPDMVWGRRGGSVVFGVDDEGGLKERCLELDGLSSGCSRGV